MSQVPSSAITVLRAIAEASAHEPVIVTEMAGKLNLAPDEIMATWRFLKEQGFIQTYNLPGSARINSRGTNHLASLPISPKPSPAIQTKPMRTVDLNKHEFTVSLSFPGEVRDLVASVATELDLLMGRHSYFYDFNYQAQLARPNLDILLQDIYSKRSKLIVVFLSSAYQEKDWCGIEWRAVKSILAKRAHDKVMLVRTDDGVVEGIFATDGYISASKFSPQAIAEFISERASLLEQ